MNKEHLIEYLKEQGFSESVLGAFKKIKREDFTPEDKKQCAYENSALPIGHNATISQPFTIAFMLDLLELRLNSKQKILEIGSGSGYVLALINEIAKGKTYGVEIINELVRRSRQTLKASKKIVILNSNGKKGLQKHAPYDRILVSAACPNLRTAKDLSKQLKSNGIIVASVKNSIFKIVKQNDGQKPKLITEEYPGFVFVPLVG